MKTCSTSKRPTPSRLRRCECTRWSSLMRCFRLVEGNLHFSTHSMHLCSFFVEAIYKSGEVLYIQSAKICHLWSRWQQWEFPSIWAVDTGWLMVPGLRERKGDCKKIDKQFEIMERKHGFNCNIMHESVSNDAKAAIRAMLLAPLGNLLRQKAERIFQFKHQSLNGINLSHHIFLPSFFNEHTSRGLMKFISIICSAILGADGVHRNENS